MTRPIYVLLSVASRAGLSSCVRDHLAPKSKIFTKCPLTGKFASPRQLGEEVLFGFRLLYVFCKTPHFYL